MPYHACPALPFHALPAAPALLEDKIAVRACGYVAAHRDILTKIVEPAT